MTQHSPKVSKRRSFFSLILGDLREAFARHRLQQSLTRAQAQLERGDPAPMQRLTWASLGDAWLALADFYAAHWPHDPALALDAYGQAAACRNWLHPSDRAEAEYDRRRFLGIGATQDFAALAHEWKSRYRTGYARETQLAWIHACGPADLRDQQQAWWWMALAEARWAGRDEVELPSLSASELREELARHVREKDRLALQAKAKARAYAEFVEGK